MQTPHPTLQSQSQIFKLPSSSPQPSPRPLSPVPTSRRLKENKPQATSTPWNRHALNPFASGIGIPTIPRKPRTRSGRARPSRSHSRSSSNSNSHSNASSRANSKERGLSSKTNPMGSDVRTRKKTKLAHKQPLASPFVSRASSPVNGAGGAHISALQASGDVGESNRSRNGNENRNKPRIIHQYTSKAKRSANVLSETFVDPNIPQHQNRAPRPDSQSMQTSPSKNHPGTGLARRDLTLHTFKRRQKVKNPLERRIYAGSERPYHYEGGLQHSYRLREDGGTYARERRPSAPSSAMPLPNQLEAPLLLADRLPRLSTLGPGRSRTKNLLDENGKENATLAPARIGSAENLQDSDLHTFLDQLRSVKGETGTTSLQRTPPRSSAAIETLRQPPPLQPPPPLESNQRRQQQQRQEQNVQGTRKPSTHRAPVRPSASMHDLHTTSTSRTTNLMRSPSMHPGPLSTHAAAPALDTDDERTSWMRVRRVGVDFNRPPSQMSLVENGGLELGMALEVGREGVGWGYVWGSASEGESEFYEEEEDKVAGDTKKKQQDFGMYEGWGFEAGAGDDNAFRQTLSLGLGSAFGEDAIIASTPADAVKRRRARGERKRKALIDDEEGVREVRRSTSMPMRLEDDDRDEVHILEGNMNEEIEAEMGKEGGMRRSVSLDEAGMRRAGRAGEVDPRAAQDDDENDDSDKDEEEDGEEDMELTSNGMGLGIFALKHSAAYDYKHKLDHDEEEDDEDADDEEGSEVSWVTDSIVSAPTVYLERKRTKAKLRHEGLLPSEFGDDQKKETLCQVDTLFGSEDDADVDEDMDEGVAEEEEDDEDGEQEQKEEDDDDKDPTPTQSQFAPSDQYNSSSDSRVASPAPGLLSTNAAGAGTGGAKTSTTATRTRSGTIVPSNVNPNAKTNLSTTTASANMTMAGARRTRSGTIVGPLSVNPPPAFALPAIPGEAGGAGTGPGASNGNGVGSQRPVLVGAAPIRTRSGTIVASASVKLDGGRGRARSGSVRWAQPPVDIARSLVDGIQASTTPINEDAADEEGDNQYQNQNQNDHEAYQDQNPGPDLGQDQDHDDIVECYVDSLYLPPDAAEESSSPDPIDFLRFAGIAEAEEEEEGGCSWKRVVQRTSASGSKGGSASRNNSGSGRGSARGARGARDRNNAKSRGGRATSVGRWARAKKRLRARFGAGGCGDEDEGDGDGEMSEDELILKSD